MNNDVFNELACRYAQAVDRRDAAAIASLFADDAELHMPGNALVGVEQIAGIAQMLSDMFECTQHRMGNQVVNVDGETASGEAYCTASHVRLKDGKREVEDWAIRYQDEFVLQQDQWRYKRRELVIDWVEIRPAMAFGEQF